MLLIIVWVGITLIVIGVTSNVYAEEVSCQYLESNRLGDYMVSKMPNGDHEIRLDYYIQAQACGLWWEPIEKKGWLNW